MPGSRDYPMKLDGLLGHLLLYRTIDSPCSYQLLLDGMEDARLTYCFRAWLVKGFLWIEARQRVRQLLLDRTRQGRVNRFEGTIGLWGPPIGLDIFGGYAKARQQAGSAEQTCREEGDLGKRRHIVLG